MKIAILSLSVLVVGLVPQLTDVDARTEAGSISLTVSIFNDAGVSQSVLSQARNRAIFIMRRAGVSLVWVDCGTPGNWLPNSGCTSISFPQHLSVRLVCKASGASDDTFGQSFQNASGEGNYALVYFGVLATSQAAKVVPTGDLLGFVIAHELGHLLLGRDSHSATGLMTAVWQTAELRQASQGHLLFTNEQQDRIRTRYLAAAGRLHKASDQWQASTGK